jgi:hypothetical protein
LKLNAWSIDEPVPVVGDAPLVALIPS